MHIGTPDERAAPLRPWRLTPGWSREEGAALETVVDS